MKPYQERAIAEADELKDRLQKLRQFINGDTSEQFKELKAQNPDEANLMLSQYSAMTDYLKALSARIGLWIIDHKLERT